MDAAKAKRLRLAKWKQAKQAAAGQLGSTPAPEAQGASEAEIASANPTDPASAPAETRGEGPAPLVGLAPLNVPAPLKLSLANLRRKRPGRERAVLETGGAAHDSVAVQEYVASTRGSTKLAQGAVLDVSVQATKKPKGAAGLVSSEARSPSSTVSASGPSESIDAALNLLDSEIPVLAAEYESESDGGVSEETQPSLRKKPKPATSKLDTIVVDHATESFEKHLLVPPQSTGMDAEAYRLANGIKTDGAMVLPLANWYSAGLPLPLLRTIEARGLLRPTPIQAQALPLIMGGTDLVGIAPTSSGKTMAFLLPLCRHVAANQTQHRKMSRGPYALVLAPTRELCLQIFREVEPLARSLQLNALGCYGGTDISSQISELTHGRCDIMVATPGRLIDLLATNHGRVLTLRGVTFLVVDETDRMFDLGFGPQVRSIVGAVRPDRQTVVFSATMAPGMEALVSRILTKPTRVTIGAQGTVPPQISQEAVLVRNPKEKLPLLLQTLESVDKEHALTLVFVDTQDRADAIALQLMAKGIKAQALHGGMDQQDRAATIAEFRSGRLPVLVATSIAARGLDVRNVKLVVNLDAASHLEDYVHRAGRTGRGGDDGRCLSILEPGQTRHAHELSRLFSVPDDVQAMADEYSKSSQKPDSGRLGFGGHGLANLEKKRDLKKTVERDAYTPRDESQEPPSHANESEPAAERLLDSKILEGAGGGSFAAILPINDIRKEARIAVTAAGNQSQVSTDAGVSMTIRGTFFPQPRRDLREDEKLHLYIEGETRDSVLQALTALTELIEDADAKHGGRYTVL